MMRSGLIAEKVGMTRIFNASGASIPVTVLKVSGCQVVGNKTQEKDGYVAIQVGAGAVKAKNVAKPQKNHYAKLGVEAKRHVVEFRVSAENVLSVGTVMKADHFAVGQFVDVVGTSIGKGFAGVMKRYNFGGLEASHGVSISHRSHGSTGCRQDPGRVWKGLPMAGHLGNKRVTIQNLEVVATDLDKGLIMVKGGVPGHDGSYVVVKDAVKKTAVTK